MSNKQQAIAGAILPRDARVPADVNSLLALDPMQHAFRHFGSLNVRMTDHIADLISETLAAAKASGFKVGQY